MGAEFWEESFPFQISKENTLRKLQEDVLEKGRYFKLYDSKEDAIRKLQNVDWSNVPESFLDDLKTINQETIERYKSLPIANTFEEKVNELHTLNEAEGTKSPLDFIGFSDDLSYGRFQYFTDSICKEFFNKKRVTYKDIKDHIEEIADSLDRLQGYCIPVFDEEKTDGQVKVLYFCGYSAD